MTAHHMPKVSLSSHWSGSLYYLYLTKERNHILHQFINFKKKKLYLTTLNYSSNYTLHPRLFVCTFCTINYDYCYTLHYHIKFVVNLDVEVWYHVKWFNCLYFQSLKNKKQKLHFITLNYTLDYTLHPKLWIFTYVNSKFNIGLQSGTTVIVYDAKHAFEMFRVQSII